MRLYITENKISLPSYLYRNGRVELDIVEAPSLTRQAFSLEANNKISVDGFTSCQVPIKGAAAAIFGYGVDAFKTKHKAVFETAGNTYPVTLQVTKITSNYYDVILSLVQDSWVSALSSMKLTDVELGETDPLDKDLIGNSMALNFTYDESQSPVLWTLGWNGRSIMKHLDNGAFVIPSTQKDVFVNEDFRFWVSPLAFFTQAFCQIGFKFECPLLESEFGRRIWMYLLSENFYEQGDLRETDRVYGGNLWNHKINKSDSIGGFTTTERSYALIAFTDTNGGFDDSHGLDIASNLGLPPNTPYGYWRNGLEFSNLYKIKFKGKFENTGADDREFFVNIRLAQGLAALGENLDEGDVVYKPSTDSYYTVQYAYSASNIVILDQFGTLSYGEHQNDLQKVLVYDKKQVLVNLTGYAQSLLEIEWDTQLRPNTIIFCTFQRAIQGDFGIVHVLLQEGATLEGFVRGHHFYTGDKVRHKNCLRPDSVLDVLKGVMHCLNLYIEENHQDRTVKFFPSDDITVPSLNGEIPIMGFYRDYQYVEERNNLLTDSLVFSTESVSRYVKIGFKNVDAFNVPDDEKDNALARTIDRGGDLNTDTDELRNPYFYGTVDVIAPNTAGIFQDGIWLPNLAVEEDTYTTSVQPRICWGQWFGAQTRKKLPFYYQNNDYSDTAIFGWGSLPSSLFAYLSNDPQAKSSPVATRGRAFTYGRRAMDLYERFWSRQIKESYPFSRIDAILLWDRVKALGFNFRDKMLLQYKGVPDIYKVRAIRDIDASRDLPALVSMTRGSAVFNPIPCDCEVKICSIYNFINITQVSETESGVSLSFFEVEGNEYIVSPIPLGDYKYTGGLLNIATNIATVLNSLNVPGFSFSIVPDSDLSGYHSIQMVYPACSRFTILFRTEDLAKILFMYTEENLYEYDSDKTEWVNPIAHKYCNNITQNCEVC